MAMVQKKKNPFLTNTYKWITNIHIYVNIVWTINLKFLLDLYNFIDKLTFPSFLVKNYTQS